MTAKAPSSPACLAHEADDAYMGFATRGEIVRFLTDFDAAPAADKVEMLRQMLPRIRDDVLYAELRSRLSAIESGKSVT
ncbi:hypothetical protein [Reyranella sp.]|jgi:hypothetical protein|uniref:hypothetical protein n=1 Tax=Reyranella sp. TaxID=1929291 RepID=UPI0040363DED